MQRGDWHGNRPSADPAEQQNAWKKQTVFCEHELPGTARHDPLAYLQNRSVDWLDHQLAARELLDIDPTSTYLVLEHEYPPARLLRCTRSSTMCCGRRESRSRGSAASRSEVRSGLPPTRAPKRYRCATN